MYSATTTAVQALLSEREPRLRSAAGTRWSLWRRRPTEPTVDTTPTVAVPGDDQIARAA